MTFEAEGAVARLAVAKHGGPWWAQPYGDLPNGVLTDLAAALDRITELEAALATAEGARLAAERGLAGEGT